MLDQNNLENPAAWTILPTAQLAMLRFPAPKILAGTRLATGIELYAAGGGHMFPWGNYPDESRASGLWHKHQIGQSGFYHDRWFITQDGRYGGASNVPKIAPGIYRRCLLLDGGTNPEGNLAENEGYALVKPTTIDDRIFYREAQIHAAKHVAADGGRVLLSPLFDDNHAYVGFTGRCQSCPNAEIISFKQLQAALPDYKLQLYPEWLGWQKTYQKTRNNH